MAAIEQQYEEPLFRSAQGALLFALNYTHGSLKQSALAEMMSDGARRKGRGLGGLVGAGQSGMIRSELEQLEHHRRDILIARYAVPSIPCPCRRPCCRGFTDNPEWSEAIDGVTKWLLAKGATGTVSHYRMRRALASRYFGVRKTSFLEVAKQCGINRDTASKYNKRVVELLSAEERLSFYEIEGRLKTGGVVE